MAQPHSEPYFNDARDDWWNEDFIALMAQRWNLADANSLLDVGCGQGHWSHLLFPHLAPNAALFGIDAEPRWITAAKNRLPSGHFLPGDARHLPFADCSFDAVTCQTVLMHLPDAKEGFLEMVRVARPGGILIAAEPNNLFNCLYWNDLTLGRSVETNTALYRFWLRYHVGKAKLGRGDNSVGERVPGIFAQAGLLDIRVHQNDRANALYPPYERPEQKRLVAAELAWKTSHVGPWDMDDLRQTFFAGGGTEAQFESARALLESTWRENQDALRAGTFRAASGSLFFLVSGRKP